MLNSKLDNLLENAENSGVDMSEIDIHISLTEQEVSDRIQDREERKKYAKRTFVFLSVFTGTVLLTIILAGFSEVVGFKLEESVLIALITSSLATVVGIFILVMQYLFKKD